MAMFDEYICIHVIISMYLCQSGNIYPECVADSVFWAAIDVSRLASDLLRELVPVPSWPSATGRSQLCGAGR